MSCERPALFLDRDGVINADVGYVHRIEEFRFLPGTLEACRRFHENGYILVIVTNQAGIAKGYYTEYDFRRLTDWMLEQFRDFGAPLSAVYYCPHHPHGTISAYTRICECRKPAPGLLIRAKNELSISMPQSVLVGDKHSDVLAGQAAGVGRCYQLAEAPHARVSPRHHETRHHTNRFPSLAAIADSLLPSPLCFTPTTTTTR